MYQTELIQAIGKHCIENGMSLSIAESVTSGHLQAAFSTADQAALFFQGGITAYNVGQKSRHLFVDPVAAASCNAVSGKIARQLAAGATRMFSSDIGIGITGYASPLPEKNIFDLHAFFCIRCGDKMITLEKVAAPGDNSLDNQLFYCNAVISACYQHLEDLIG